MTHAPLDGRFDLDGATYEAIVAHARSDTPYEVCGLLAGADGRVQARHPVDNVARSMTFYSMDPKQLLAAFRAMDDAEHELLAIYHSHTHTEAFPSPTDVELAAYPEAVYLIVSLQEPAQPVIRGFTIIDGHIAERVVHVDGEPAPRAHAETHPLSPTT